MTSSVYGWLKDAERAFKELDQLADQFDTARTIANERMGAAPAIRNEINEMTNQLKGAATTSVLWWPLCKTLHPRDTFRPENPVEGSAVKEGSRDVGVAKKEM